MADRGSYSYGSEGPATAVAEQPLPLSADKKKPVLVTGANGLVGIHTCRELSKNGWQVRALVRDPAKAAMALGQLPVEFRVGDVRDATALRSSLNGCGAVVHLAAIAIEKKGETYQESNTAATERLISAARAENVQRVIFMSQNGADRRSPYPFLHSKGVAQDSIKTSGLRWTVLRPSVIFGPEDQFVNVLGRLIRLTPKIFPLPGGGTARFQPIAVDDRARGASVTRQKGDSSSDLRLGRCGAAHAARDDRAYSHRDGNASEARIGSGKNPQTDRRTCSEVSAESAGHFEPPRPARARQHRQEQRSH
ncbi:MAG: hypothetical protein DMD30_12595 [Gemmatimonadetes bacterium]|nr:MAG: hypothetical protein DMD30_12595 [Gemmatimonadota bacterium]